MQTAARVDHADTDHQSRTLHQSPPPPFCFMNKRLNSNHIEAAAYFLVVLAAGAGAPLVAPPEAPDLVAEFCDLRFEACSSRAFLASFFLITTRSWYFFASSLEAMAFSRLNWRSERLRCFCFAGGRFDNVGEGNWTGGEGR